MPFQMAQNLKGYSFCDSSIIDYLCKRIMTKDWQNADLVKLEDHALDAVTGGTDAFQTVLCRYGLHRPGRQVNECSFVCACCGKTFAVAMQETDPSLQTGVWDKKP